MSKKEVSLGDAILASVIGKKRLSDATRTRLSEDEPETVRYVEPAQEPAPKLSKKQKAGLLVGSAALGFFLGTRKSKRWSVFKK